MGEKSEDPCALRFGGGGTSRERGRRLWAVGEEEVREAGGCHSEIRVDALAPLVFDGEVWISAVDGDLCYSTSDAIEARGEADGVEFVFYTIGCYDAFLGEFFVGVLSS